MSKTEKKKKKNKRGRKTKKLATDDNIDNAVQLRVAREMTVRTICKKVTKNVEETRERWQKRKAIEKQQKQNRNKEEEKENNILK